ncbi:MAG: hypothetical protein SOV63_03655 [Pyramidobacter porci]|nr:hypothetical protein [Pyramidobacter porci]
MIRRGNAPSTKDSHKAAPLLPNSDAPEQQPEQQHGQHGKPKKFSFQLLDFGQKIVNLFNQVAQPFQHDGAFLWSQHLSVPSRPGLCAGAFFVCAQQLRDRLHHQRVHAAALLSSPFQFTKQKALVPNKTSALKIFYYH